MKKIIALVLISILTLSVLTSCFDKNKSTGDESTKDETTNEVTTSGENDGTTEEETEEIPYNYNLGEYLIPCEYKGLNIKKDYIESMFKDAVNDILAFYAEEIDIIDRAIEYGDIVDMEYSGRLEGEDEPFEGGTGSEDYFVIGDNNFIEGFDLGLVGRGLGDDKVFEIEVVFPSDYHAASLAGKTAIFTIKIKRIYTEVYPELTDDIVKERTLYSSVEELEEAYKKNIIASYLFEKVYDGFRILTYPEKEFNKMYNEVYKQYKDFAASLGVSLDKYVSSYLGMSISDFENELKKMVEAQMKQEMVLRYIARTENITISASEYNKTAIEYIKLFDYDDIDEFMSDFDMSRSEFYDYLVFVKTQYFIAEYANILD